MEKYQLLESVEDPMTESDFLSIWVEHLRSNEVDQRFELPSGEWSEILRYVFRFLLKCLEVSPDAEGPLFDLIFLVLL